MDIILSRQNDHHSRDFLGIELESLFEKEFSGILFSVEFSFFAKSNENRKIELIWRKLSHPVINVAILK